MKKKLLSVLLCIIAVANLTACGRRINIDALKEDLRDEIEDEIREELEEELRAEIEQEIRNEMKEEEKEDDKKEEEKEDDEEQVTPPVKTPTLGSKDWSSMTFVLDGKSYTLPFSYSDIKFDWSFDLADYGHADGYTLNPREYVYPTIHLEHDTYDCDFSVGLENNSTTAKDITECDIWAASVDIMYSDSYPSLELPGGLTWGSTLKEVEDIFGIPEDTYYSEALDYWQYNYDIDSTYKFSVTVYEDNGLTEFEFRIYD